MKENKLIDLRWRWCKPDSVGVWAFCGDVSETADHPVIEKFIVVGVSSVHITGWWCRISDLPVILPPARELSEVSNSPWVFYADRRPTIEDGDNEGMILSRLSGDKSIMRHYECHDHLLGKCWMRLRDLPAVPKRKVWREPTQADLDAATEPIPCRMWDRGYKSDETLVAITKLHAFRFIARNGRFQNCEIEVDES